MDHFDNYTKYLHESKKSRLKKKFNKIARLKRRKGKTDNQNKKFKLQQRIDKLQRDKKTILTKLNEDDYNKKILLKALNQLLLKVYEMRRSAKRERNIEATDKWVNNVEALKKLIKSIKNDDKNEIIASHITDLEGQDVKDIVNSAYDKANISVSDLELQELELKSREKQLRKARLDAAKKGKLKEFDKIKKDDDIPQVASPGEIPVKIPDTEPSSETKSKIKLILQKNIEDLELPINSLTAPLLSIKLVKQKLLVVKFLQKILKDLGYFKLVETIETEKDVDGVYGKRTKKAVEAFQKTYELTVNGIVGKNTWRKLYEIFDSDIDDDFKVDISLLKPVVTGDLTGTAVTGTAVTGDLTGSTVKTDSKLGDKIKNAKEIGKKGFETAVELGKKGFKTAMEMGQKLKTTILKNLDM